MDIVYKNHKGGMHSILFKFEKGEKCFCCSKVFSKKTDVSQTFLSEKEFEEYSSMVKYYYQIDIINN